MNTTVDDANFWSSGLKKPQNIQSNVSSHYDQLSWLNIITS